MINGLKFYHSLPYPLRVLTASLRGYQLRWWRYGKKTEELVEEAIERETWPQEKWEVWQENRLEFLLNNAATRVPFYRNYWEERHRKGDKASWYFGKLASIIKSRC